MGKKAAAKQSEQAPEPKKLAPDERPPRPSHGFKWDEEQQAWVNKGSQAERKAAKLKEAAPQSAADGTVLKSWQSMPSQLLLEWAKREKRPNPSYAKGSTADKSMWRKKAVLTDPKKQDNTLEFMPDQDSETEAVAKEHAALLALLKVQGSLPLDKKLPEPYCDIWKASVAATQPEPKAKAKAKAKAKETSSHCPQGGAEATAAADEDDVKPFAPLLRAASQFASKAEKQAAQLERLQERNKRQAERDGERRANMPAPILLATKMRAQLREALCLDVAWGAVTSGIEADMGEDDAAAVARCIDWGFDTSETMRALAAIKAENGSSGNVEAVSEQMRQWLCLHLPEEELPEQFAASRGQFTVHTAKNAKTSFAEKNAEQTAPINQFDMAKEALMNWLRDELAPRVDASSVDALLASVESILFFIDPMSAEDDEAEEAGENAAVVLASEGEELEALGQDLQERWKAVWATRVECNAAEAKAEGGDDPEDDEAATTAGEDAESDAMTTGADENFWESGVERNQGGSAAPKSRATGSHRGRNQGPWFGTGIGSAKVVAAETSWARTAEGQRMAKHRQGLPAAKSKDELMQLCRDHQVVLVQGETGCGKTTQVGQFLLETDAAARVIVTQPRRVAATSVAQRVSDERGEKIGVGSVGYSVRGESKIRKETCRLLFCTNGVLLRRLLGEPDFMFSEQTCTHLVIDEVHERSIEIDLLLTLLREFLPKRRELRVLLMSATMDVNLLADLFPGRPPTVKMPGRTFPVKQLFIDDVQDQLGLKTWSAGSTSTGIAAQAAEADDGEGSCLAGKPVFLSHLDFGSIAEIALAALRGKLPDAPEDGAVLIFVPGVGEIDKVSKELQHRSTKGEMFVLPLHGGLPSAQQHRCFQVLAKGGPRKIVVSTNVAETSVTVPDITVVVDTCRERRLQLEPGAVAPCLAEALCARSSLTQRRGRAGRVRAGLCITMVSWREYEKLPADAPPEIEAAALESLCLQVRVCGFQPDAFLAKMPTPPRPTRVEASERLLAKIGATCSQAGKGGDDHVNVAALGRHLAALPCDVHIGKLLVVGAFLGVASMAADVAAMLSVRSPLKSTIRDPDAAAWREKLRQSLRPGGTKSDHCLLAKLLQLWNDSSGNRRDLCKNAAVAWERMAEASSVRSQLLGALRGLGFGSSEGDRCAGEWRALRVAVTAAFYPQIAKVVRPAAEYTDALGGAIQKQAEARKLRYFVQADPTDTGSREDSSTGRWGREVRAFLHPASLLFKETSYSCPYVIFSSKQIQQSRGSAAGYATKLNLSESSEASIYALLLFGGHLQVDYQDNEVTIDDWIRFSGGSTTIIALVERLRGEIEKLLLQKIEQPWLRLEESPICRVVVTLLSTDGLG